MKRPVYNFCSRSRRFIGLLLQILLFANPASLLAAPDTVSQFIQKRCQYLQQLNKAPVCSTCVASGVTIPKFYMDRDYQPAWTDEALIDQMLEAIQSSYDHGLDPADYHFTAIKELLDKISLQGDNPADRADLDVLLTDALLRLSFHLFYGKVSPESLDPNWNFKRKILDKDPAQYLARVISSGNITESLDALWPHHPYYETLRVWLRKYRAFAKHPWKKLTLKKTLRPGYSGPEVVLLRERLEAEEFYHPEKELPHPELFDKDLVKAVKLFQFHHGLKIDGIVGKNTLHALNLSPSFKVNKLRVNLERARWILHNLPSEFLMVNIAAFQLYYIKDGQEKWSCKVMVGKPFWKTPVFRAKMEYIVLNPYWVVPPGILEKELIPKLRRDPSYLAKHNMEMVDAKGRQIDPESIDWDEINPARFPYIIRQAPGPRNALGRIKFIFPNKHFVFLHDTPARFLFSRHMRAFSHGCIRVEKPLELA
ncbi:MAG: L,D-transpeptidase family protein, partial [Thermodesulfobacteria bacterium]|nr:L,D-transpeptidase family protein [Thermodesulfobacteriota bacterium]